jgi:hypothetical protein
MSTPRRTRTLAALGWLPALLPLLLACEGSSGKSGDAAASGGALGDAGPGGVNAAPDPDAPRVRAVLPDRSPLAGGVTVRIEGVRLDAVTELRFGEHAGEITAHTDTALEVKVPAAEAGGAVTLTLVAPGGTSTWRGFRYYGIAASALRFVEVPDAADAVSGDALYALRTSLAPRVVVGGAGALSVLEPGAGGRLTVKGTGEAPPSVRAACVADFDADGADDLFLADASGAAGVYRRAGSGLAQPSPLAGVPAVQADCADYNGDDAPDVLVVLAPPEGVAALQLLVGDGRGGLMPAAGGRPLGAAVVTGLASADFDADGHRDVLLGLEVGRPRLFVGDGGGGFIDALPGKTPAGPEAVAPLVADFDGDGQNDVFLLGPAGAALWLGDADGGLVDRSALNVGVLGLTGAVLSTLDADLDGAPDVLAVGAEGARLLRNDGQGRLFDYTSSLVARPGTPAPTRLVALDLDGDDDVDLVGLRPGAAAPIVLRNWAPQPFSDRDADGLPDSLDNCPDVSNPDQRNRDAAHFHCETPEVCQSTTGCALAVDAGANRALLSCPAQALTPADAAAFCTRLGGRLWMPQSPEEQGVVAALGPAHLWLDLTDAAAEGTFVSADGRAAPFASWGPGQPDNAGGTEHCVELITDDPAAPFWNDLPCDLPRGVACEDTVTVTPADPPDACDNCPDLHNPDQADRDADGAGDACDVCPDDPDPAATCPPVMP